MALLMTMNDLPLPEVEEIETGPRNQWHRDLLRQANENPVSHRNWETQAQAKSEPCHGYEFDCSGQNLNVKATVTNYCGQAGGSSGGGGQPGFNWPDNAI